MIQITIAKDNGFADDLYDIKWYVLPYRLQKSVIFMIALKQNSTGIPMGPFKIMITCETFNIVSWYIWVA